MHTRKVLISSLVAGLIIVFLTYAAIESRGLFFGPKIDLYSPLEGITTTESIVLVNGQTTRTKELVVNGGKILIDTEGRFSVNLVLSPGYNIMTIVATDARGAQQTLTRHIYFKAPWLTEFNNSVEEEATTTITAAATNTTASTSSSD